MSFNGEPDMYETMAEDMERQQQAKFEELGCKPEFWDDFQRYWCHKIRLYRQMSRTYYHPDAFPEEKRKVMDIIVLTENNIEEAAKRTGRSKEDLTRSFEGALAVDQVVYIAVGSLWWQ